MESYYAIINPDDISQIAWECGECNSVTIAKKPFDDRTIQTCQVCGTMLVDPIKLKEIFSMLTNKNIRFVLTKELIKGVEHGATGKEG